MSIDRHPICREYEEVLRVQAGLIRAVLIMTSVVLLAVGCQDDNDEVAREIGGDVIGTPQAAPELEQDIEEITISISNGVFDEDEIELIQDRPTVLTVQNDDDVAYLLNIDPLVTSTAIPASETTRIEFTTPVSNEYVGELLPESSDEPVDTLRVLVIGAIGVP